MASYKEFTVTEEHIKLLKAAYIRYDDGCEFGAPAIDSKRPYGNSSVYYDIAEILGVEKSDDDYEPFTDEQESYMLKVHVETAQALQIFVSTGVMKPGTYRARKYHNDWEEVKDEDS